MSSLAVPIPHDGDDEELERILHYPCQFKQVPIKKLFVDSRYQRNLLPTKIRRMVANFDPLQLTALVVNRINKGKPNEQYRVIDGQQRHAVLQTLKITHAPCQVYEDLTYEQEATLFVHLNRNSTKVHPVDVFRAAIEGKDPAALEIKEILDRYKIKVSKGKGPRNLKAINAAITIYTEPALEKYKRSGPKALDVTLKVLTNSWTTEDSAMRGEFILGLGYLLLHYNEIELPVNSLIEKIRVTPPHDVLRVAASLKGYARGGGSGSRMPYAQAFIQIYNKGRRTRHLEDRLA